MLKEVALNLFEAMPHAAFNIADFAKGIGANFTANIGSALLNTVLQIVFFIGVLFVIPWLSSIVVSKYNDTNELLAEYNKADEEGNEKKKNALLSVITISYKLFFAPVMIIKSWTSTLLSELIRGLILILSFNRPSDFECYIDKGDEGGIPKGFLHVGYCKFYMFRNPLHSLKKPWRLVGLYISWVAYMIVPLLFPVAVLYFLLPNTFASVVSGLGQWVELQSGTPNLAFFTNMALVFKDIAWDKLVVGGLNENVLVFAFLIIVSVLYTDHSMPLIGEAPVIDENDEPTGDVEKKLAYEVYSWIIIAIIICLVNVALAMFSDVYLTISYQVNSVGMILLFVILVKEIIAITASCIKKIVKIIMKLEG